MRLKKLITLAYFEAYYKDELEADFRQYYNLDIGGMGSVYSYEHAACLCAQLPINARSMRKLNGLDYELNTYLLNMIELDIRSLASGLSGGKEEQKPLLYVGKDTQAQTKIMNTDINYINKVLGGDIFG